MLLPMNTLRKALFVLLFSVIAFTLPAQLNYKNGYIISLENDTIYGLINDGGGYRNSKLCLFKETTKSKAVKYAPGEIKSYRFTGEKYYSSKEVSFDSTKMMVFVDVLLEGKINLYHHWKNGDLAFYMEKDSNELIGLLNKRVSVLVSPEKYANLLKSRENLAIYKDTLVYLFSDSEIIKNQVDDIRYSRKSLLNVTKAYINETCEGDDCIVYEKDLNHAKPAFGVFTGLQMSRIMYWESTEDAGTETSVYELPVDAGYTPSFRAGVFFNIPLTGISDRLRLQTELIANQTVYKTGSIQLPGNNQIYIKSNSITLPLMLKYTLPGRKFSPALALGKESTFIYKSLVYDPLSIDPDDPNGNILRQILHKSQRGGWFCELGVQYKIHPKVSLFTNIRYQTNYNMVIAQPYEDNSANQIPWGDVYNYRFYSHRFRSNLAAVHLGVSF